MTLTSDDVLRLARLARIAIDDREAEDMLGRLNEILELIGQIRAVDTTGVEPMIHVEEPPGRLREDVVTEGDQREAFQALAPAVADGLYLVPKVIE